MKRLLLPHGAEHRPTKRFRDLVKIMSATGCKIESIAHCIGGTDNDPGINVNTLRKHYARELQFTPDKANGLVADSLLQLALKGNLGACIFWLKTRAQWRENDSLQLNGKLEVVKRVIGVNDADI